MPRTPAPRWEVDDYLSYLLARASRVVATGFHREVRDAGLTVPEWRVLATLADGGARTLGELAAIVLAQQSTATKLVGRMQAQGWVERGAGDVDRRHSLVTITADGHAMLGSLLARSKRHEAATIDRLSAREAAVLKGALRKLIAASDDAVAAPLQRASTMPTRIRRRPAA